MQWKAPVFKEFAKIGKNPEMKYLNLLLNDASPDYETWQYSYAL